MPENEEPTTTETAAADGEAEAPQAVAEAPAEETTAAVETPPEPPAEVTMPDEKVLDPATLRIFRGEDGIARLEVEGDRCLMGFTVARLFPITHRLGYLSIADPTGEELGVLYELRALPRAMRRILLEELRRRYMVPQITYVNSLRTEYGILYWDVETTRGRREFVVREVRDNIREFAGGRMQISDVDGNQFEIRNADELKGKGVAELYRLM